MRPHVRSYMMFTGNVSQSTSKLVQELGNPGKHKQKLLWFPV